jgi:predicted DNA-binding helix-hairpin-helix protein
MVSFSAEYRRWEIDRKLAWALEHREAFPVDLNRAPREALLRVPGVGPATADWILALRRERPIAAADVRRLPVNWFQLRYFVATSDHAPRRFVPGPGAAECAEASERGRLSQRELFEARATRQ